MSQPVDLPDGISEALRERFGSLSAADQARVLAQLAQSRTRRHDRIPRLSKQRYAPSPAQQRTWFVQQLEPESPAFNQTSRWRLRGCLDVAAIGRSLTEIVRRHEVLRTRYLIVDGELVQDVMPAMPIDVDTIDVSREPDDSALTAFVNRIGGKPFDLSSGPVVRAGVAKLGADDHQLVIVRHHIASDRWSVGQFLKELSALYEAARANLPSPLPELPIQYGDFAEWARERAAAPGMSATLEQIVQGLQGAEPPSLLPDSDHPGTISHRGGRAWGGLPADVVRPLRDLAVAHNATLFMSLTAIFNVLVHRYTGQTDIVIGAPIAGRAHPDTEPLLGLFANTLALRADLAGNPSFLELLDRVRSAALRAFEHQDVPFERVLGALRPDHLRSAEPFTKLMFVLQNVPYEGLELPDVEVETLDAPLEAFAGDLALVTWEEEGRLVMRADYNADRFAPALIQRMLGHFAVLAETVVRNPAARLSELCLLTPEERRHIAVDLNRTAAPYPSGRRIEDLFRDEVKRNPDAVAVVDGEREVTYRELNDRACCIARRLRSLGITRGDRVVLLLDRSWEFVASFLGSYMAGACYVALDPHHARVRLNMMLDDTRPAAVVLQAGFEELVPEGCARLIVDDRLWRDDEGAAAFPGGEDGVTNEDAACILFTSGSTGQPKGVILPHRAIVNHSSWIARTYGSGPEERVLQASPFSFDASVWELTMPLITGGAIVIGSPLGRIDPPAFIDAIIQGKITSLLLVPAQIPFLLEQSRLDDCVTLRHVFVGGEKFPAAFAASLAARIPAHIHNIYGPTETCVNSTMHEWQRGSEAAGIVPIGQPIGNTEIYLLDAHDDVAPLGVPGEVCIGGHGLAHGYLNAPELTARKFTPHPFDKDRRIYRTGDRARRLEDGSLEFLGRIDNQFKLRGIRIESGEIEAALASHPAIASSAVIVRGADNESARLIAFVVARAGSTRPSDAVLRAFLRERLPEVMVPAVYQWLPQLPLNRHGKVDRHALPDVVDTTRSAAVPGVETSTETRLRALWAEVLDLRQAGLDEHFFDVGGHSLLAVRLFARIEEEFGTRLRISKLFEAPTIRSLARVIDGATEPSPSSLVVIRGQGNRTPLHIVHGIGGEVLGFELLARHLPHDQPVFAFEAIYDKHEIHGVVDTARAYVEMLVRAQPDGPYYISGYSSGGPLAFEMACQLEQAGHHVGLLLMMDAGLPPRARRRIALPSLSVAAWVRHIGFWIVDDALATHPVNWLGRIRSKTRLTAARLVSRMRGGPKARSGAVDVRDELGIWAFPDHSTQYLERRWQELASYEPGKFPGRAVVIRSRTGGLLTPRRQTSGWEALTDGGAEHHMLGGSHDNILTEPRVRRLAEIVTHALDTAARTTTRSATGS